MRTDLSPDVAATPEGRAAEAVLRACVHCGFCNATCPTYRLTGDELDGPRGRIYLIKQALEGGAVSRVTQRHLDRCLSCRSCETTCPSGVSYHSLYAIGRAYAAARVKRPVLERLKMALVRWAAPHPGRFGLALALGRLLRPLLPAPLRRKVPAADPARAWPAGGHPRRMLVLEGCVQAVATPRVNAALARVLDRAGIAAEPGAGCCGAVSAHLDDPEGARAMARRNIDAWLAADAEALVSTASGCGLFVRDYPELLADDPAYAPKARALAAKLRDPVEVLEGLGLPAVGQGAVAVHEPCSQRHGLKLAGRVEALLAGLGFAPQPVTDGHICCGSAGAYSLLQPELSGRLRDDKLAALTAGRPEQILTANIGCHLHLAEASPVPVRHWLEAVDAAMEREA